jgi:hypothetical protein
LQISNPKMKFSTVFGLYVLLFACSNLAESSTNLFPGVTFFRPESKVSGRFLFERAEELLSFEKTFSPATVCGFDLQTRNLYRISTVMAGWFFSSPDGSAFCTVSADNPGMMLATNYACTYSEITQRTNLVAIPSPSLVVVRSNFVQFYIGASFHPTSIIKYDLIENALSEQRNLGFDFNTPDDANYRAGDSFVYFDGPERPTNGSKLILAPYPPDKADIVDPKRERARTLVSFSRFIPAMYFFQSISPCGKYALIRQDKHAIGPDGNPWSKYTYYIVELKDGKTEKILVDETRIKSPANKLVGFSWVADFPRK